MLLLGGGTITYAENGEQEFYRRAGFFACEAAYMLAPASQVEFIDATAKELTFLRLAGIIAPVISLAILPDKRSGLATESPKRTCYV